MELLYELTTLHDVVEKRIRPDAIVTEHPDEVVLKEYYHLVHTEMERIKAVVRERMMNIKKEHQKKEYILQHQVNLARLADIVYNYLLPKTKNELYKIGKGYSPDNLYRKVFLELEELLEFMREDFHSYFSRKAKAPEVWCWLLELEIKEKLPFIKRDLKSNGVDEALIEVACMPLASMIMSENDLSYQAHAFLQLIVKKVSAFHHISTCKNPTEKFLKLLWRINFNSVWLYNYCIVSYDQVVKNAVAVHASISFLQLQEKMLKQIPVRTDIAYRFEHPSIVEMLLRWIKEEISLLKEEQAQAKVLRSIGKLMTVLSVEELGYGCRLLHGEGLFPDIEEAELLDIVAASFVTPKSKDISIDSIRNKSGKPGPNAKQRVKGYLYEMARKVR